jgi:hypothetical protein
MRPALKERSPQEDGRENQRRLASVLASRNVAETIRHCSSSLEILVSRAAHPTPGEHRPTVSARLVSSFPKMIIIKEAGLDAHKWTLESALSLVHLAKGATECDILAARLMLADIRQDGSRGQALVGQDQRIARMRLRVKDLLKKAEASLIRLPSTTSDRIDAGKKARTDVLELKRHIQEVYVLRSVGQDMDIVRRSLALIASGWARNDPTSETGDMGTLAAGAMLQGMGERYTCHSRGYTNIFLENRGSP